jgi:hypothetical protein
VRMGSSSSKCGGCAVRLCKGHLSGRLFDVRLQQGWAFRSVCCAKGCSLLLPRLG